MALVRIAFCVINATRIWVKIAAEKATLRPRPEGTSENSPAFQFQRWVWFDLTISPGGTAEASDFGCPFGTCISWLPSPALKRWTILDHPSGKVLFKSYWH